MNDKIYISDSNKFEEIIQSFESSYRKISDIVGNQKKNVEKINETDIWSGNASKAMYLQYKKLNGNYDQILYSLDIYIRFLKKTIDDYKRLEQEIGKNIDDMASALDVNS